MCTIITSSQFSIYNPRTESAPFFRTSLTVILIPASHFDSSKVSFKVEYFLNVACAKRDFTHSYNAAKYFLIPLFPEKVVSGYRVRLCSSLSMF